jgi:hypothetical protein
MQHDDLTKHPMYTPSDISYLRGKGYADEEILALWNRDRANGHEPVHHAPIPDILDALRSGRDENA